MTELTDLDRLRIEAIKGLIDHLPDAGKCLISYHISVCPYDCDSCHDEDCICDRLGCANSEAPGAK